ncbi:hypothetical protein OZ664_00365 [Elizabethkingia sp. HX WHF]|uniref:hypothetical protein n=1 Tax=Elizabethkingia TaxID=308865 RepID=UPI00099B078B|nr:MULTISPECIES: hypothetical protein [Elizabethkingia]ATL45349.1 hypothetical protein CQS02_19620 [Elizabethkingia miricola]MCL1636383.1 hypothetical protein [Elizabethkingia bruuniana]MDX8562436.1 hypothetical protein [Elizabethkingia sp. HX WHF]OPC21633.1 hypothetical protein BAY00_08145 [Elizabethkingia bruuniana]
MGTWGLAISSNDTYADVYTDFFDLYDDGLDVAEISEKLITTNQEIINDIYDSNNFWFALAKAQWQCKQLDNKILERIRIIIETGADLDVWQKLGISEKEIKKRKVVLDKFLIDLQTEKPKARGRKKKVIRQPVFEKGDCLIFKLENGNYGGVVVLEAIKDTEQGWNLLAATRINQPNKPTIKDFDKAEALVINYYANAEEKLNIGWYLPVRHKDVVHLIEKVDHIDVQIKYEINSSMVGLMADFDIYMIQEIEKQLEYEKTKPQPATKQTIKKLTKKE